MTVARIAAMQLFILSALLFLGNSVVSGESEVVEHALTHEASLDHSGDEDLVLLNASKKPTLQPKPSPPLVETYELKNRQGRVCVRASMGVEFTVIENKKSLFFNMDPKSTKRTGYCGDQRTVLSLVFDGGNLEFTFIKEGSLSYVSKLRATLQPQPPCNNCKSKTYPGIMDHEKLFKTNTGKSFMCKSDTSLILADSLRLKLVSLQIQAFDLPNGAFGKEVECWADYTKRIIPIVLGAVVVGIILIAVLVYVLTRERRGQGYERL
ncbi:lysosome-associated membrane glycoprotein 3 [Colossoma macropomum]|uniref:lysosome-associated membrane glycoprotein 3 n=1 Tax=Colossoma macropomum TaxID=42526 RepID=UPI0018656BBD|nr:lysosome-associated membrane glycoprotein 3 [Colossoma macropomum]